MKHIPIAYKVSEGCKINRPDDTTCQISLKEIINVGTRIGAIIEVKTDDTLEEITLRPGEEYVSVARGVSLRVPDIHLIPNIQIPVDHKIEDSYYHSLIKDTKY